MAGEVLAAAPPLESPSPVGSAAEVLVSLALVPVVLASVVSPVVLPVVPPGSGGGGSMTMTWRERRPSANQVTPSST